MSEADGYNDDGEAHQGISTGRTAPRRGIVGRDIRPVPEHPYAYDPRSPTGGRKIWMAYTVIPDGPEAPGVQDSCHGNQLWEGCGPGQSEPGDKFIWGFLPSIKNGIEHVWKMTPMI